MFIDFLGNSAAGANEYLGDAVEPFCACLIGEGREFALGLTFTKKSSVCVFELLLQADLFLALFAEPARSVIVKKLNFLHLALGSRKAMRRRAPSAAPPILLPSLVYRLTPDTATEFAAVQWQAA